MDTSVIAYVDKTVVKISGIEVKGLKPYELERKLTEYIGRPIRVIGVTGESLEMDIYGLEPESVLKDEGGFIKVVSTVDGITATEVVRVQSAEKATEVALEDIPTGEYSGCGKERWVSIGK